MRQDMRNSSPLNMGLQVLMDNTPFFFSWILQWLASSPVLVFTSCVKLSCTVHLPLVLSPDSADSKDVLLTPWFKLIVKNFLIQWWNKLDCIQDQADRDTIHRMLWDHVQTCQYAQLSYTSQMTIYSQNFDYQLYCICIVYYV